MDSVTEFQRRSKLASQWSFPFLVAAIACGLGLVLLALNDWVSPLLNARLMLALLFALVVRGCCIS
jgi:hypothetical protein